MRSDVASAPLLRFVVVAVVMLVLGFVAYKWGSTAAASHVLSLNFIDFCMLL